MTVSINCVCNFRDDLRWHCEWATVGADRRVDRRAAFSVTPAQFVLIVEYLESTAGNPGHSTLRPELDQLAFHLRFRRNADAFELRIRAQNVSLKAMIDKRQLSGILDYHRNCLKNYALDIYEGRTQIPEGYPQGYPEPCWHVDG